MSQRISKQTLASSANYSKGVSSIDTAVVVGVILDETHPRLRDTVEDRHSEVFSGDKNLFNVGCVIARRLSDKVTAEEKLPIYYPQNSTNLDLPIVGETIEIVGRYYRRIPVKFLNQGSASKNAGKKQFDGYDESSGNKASSYSSVSQTGTTQSTSNSKTEAKYGDYFEINNVNRLKLYEGDNLFQSRFGQSIRFSGYNNSDNILSPTIIIRNRQNSKSLNDLKIGDITEENIIDDGSTIAITSGEYLSDFTPGTTDTPLETTPEVFDDYPSELKGDQILINSGRIILSSKESEMIFFSKGNYGFVSDGKFSIDNGNDGASMNFNGDVRITTNDNNTFILGGAGEIYLNTEETTEPIARGQTLIDLLEELINAINKQVFSTPSGPTAVGPNNKGDFNKIKSKLDTILSTLNYTE